MTAIRLRILLLSCALGLLVAPAAAAAPADSDRDGLANSVERRLARAGNARVIVRLSEDATRRRVARLEERTAVDALRRLPLVEAFAARGSSRELRALAARPAVELIEPDLRVRAFNNMAQASFGVTAARLDLPLLDGDLDGDPATYSADDLVAAVIDTGIDPAHLDLDDGKVIAFKDIVNDQTGAYDDEGHGTHVAATIAGDGEGMVDGRYRGVAPAAGLVGVKVLDSEGSGWSSDVIAGINWTVANRAVYGIEAINLSLGSEGCSDGDDAEGDAVAAAHAAGIVVVAAAGNEGPDLCTVGSPAAVEEALTVGAMADLSLGGFFPAKFSSRGPTEDGRTKPDVMAPGVGITSAVAGTTSGYASWNGTSMATPFVVGVTLLLRDLDATLTPDEIKAAITSTAVDWGPLGADYDFGAGRLDAYAALAAAGADLTDAPAVPGHAELSGNLAGVGAFEDFSVELTDTSFPLTVTITRGQTPLGFSAVVRDPNGVTVESTATAERQGVMSVDPALPGTYTVKVTRTSGQGSFAADFSGGFAEAPTGGSEGPIDPPDPEDPDGPQDPPDPGPEASGETPTVDLGESVRLGAVRARGALRALTSRRLRRRGGFSFDASAPAGGSYLVYVRSGSMTVARATRDFADGGERRLRVKLTRGGRRLLRLLKRPKCAVIVSFTTPTGASASATRFTRPRRASGR